jgi:hypothetical protein
LEDLKMYHKLADSDNLTQAEALELSTTGIIREVDNGDGGTCWIEFDFVTEAEIWDNQ